MQGAAAASHLELPQTDQAAAEQRWVLPRSVLLLDNTQDGLCLDAPCRARSPSILSVTFLLSSLMGRGGMNRREVAES